MSSIFSLDLMDVLCVWLITVVIIIQKVSQDKLFMQNFWDVGKFSHLWVAGWVKKFRIGKLLQCEEVEKQAGWVKKSGIGKLLQWEEVEKQASWVKKFRNGKSLQWEEVEKQAGWGEKSGIGKLLQWEE